MLSPPTLPPPKFGTCTYSPHVKQYFFEGDCEFFCSHAWLSGDLKMRNNLTSLSQFRILRYESFPTICHLLEYEN